jgi:hypothetical protein
LKLVLVNVTGSAYASATGVIVKGVEVRHHVLIDGDRPWKPPCFLGEVVAVDKSESEHFARVVIEGDAFPIRGTLDFAHDLPVPSCCNAEVASERLSDRCVFFGLEFFDVDWVSGAPASSASSGDGSRPFRN